MKAVSTQLAAHMSQGQTTLAYLWKIIRTDGTILGFTTHDQDIVYNDMLESPSISIRYEAATGYSTGNRQGKDDMAVDGLEVTGFLESSSLTESDIRAGFYDDALVQELIVNWADLSMGHMIVSTGTVGIISMKNGMFTAEIRGLAHKLTTILVQTYGSTCRADLFSTPANSGKGTIYFCNLNVANFQQTGSVASSADTRTIVPAAGLLEVGAAAGLSSLIPVQTWTLGQNATGSSETVSVSLANPVQTGNSLLVVIWTYLDSAYSGPSDNQGNVYTLLASVTSNGLTGRIYLVTPAIAGFTAISITVTATLGAPITISASEIQGLLTFDTANSNAGSGGETFSLNTGPVVTTVANEIVFSAAFCSGSLAQPSPPDSVLPTGYTGLSNIDVTEPGGFTNQAACAFLTAVSPGSFGPTWTNAFQFIGRGMTVTLKSSNAPTWLPAATDWFTEGVITFTSGSLNGQKFEIKSWDGVTLGLYLSMPSSPSPGDTFIIEPGCDKRSATCSQKFNNIVNFRGEPFIPGMDEILNYPG